MTPDLHHLNDAQSEFDGGLPGGLRRSDVYGAQLAGGRLRPQSPWATLAGWLSELITSSNERQQRALEQRVGDVARELSQTSHIAVLSPKGGVGKTTCTLLVGDALARHGRLRCVAVDANPDYGTLGSLAPDQRRSERSLLDLLDHADEVTSPGELRPFLSLLDSGLHLLATLARAQAMAAITPEHCRRLLALLEGFYELIVLDLGTGLVHLVARFAFGIADQTLVVCTPEWVTAERVLAALEDLQGTNAAAGRLTLVLNQAPERQAVDRQVLESAFRRQQVSSRVAVPYDPLLRRMLDAGAYHPDQLPRPTRLAVLELAVAVAEGLR